VGPPSAQWMMWWPSVHAGGRSYPGKLQPWSRRCSAVRRCAGIVRVARPTESGSARVLPAADTQPSAVGPRLRERDESETRGGRTLLRADRSPAGCRSGPRPGRVSRARRWTRRRVHRQRHAGGRSPPGSRTLPATHCTKHLFAMQHTIVVPRSVIAIPGRNRSACGFGRRPGRDPSAAWRPHPSTIRV
jgi:hypothetical protein